MVVLRTLEGWSVVMTMMELNQKRKSEKASLRRAQVRPCYQPPKEEKIKTCHGGYLKTTEGPLPHEVCHNCLAIFPLLEKDPKELRSMLADIERPFAIESGIQGLAIISLARNISRGVCVCEKKALMCGGRIVTCVPRHIHRTPPTRL